MCMSAPFVPYAVHKYLHMLVGVGRADDGSRGLWGVTSSHLLQPFNPSPHAGSVWFCYLMLVVNAEGRHTHGCRRWLLAGEAVDAISLHQL
jgi:hypothetical protein